MKSIRVLHGTAGSIHISTPDPELTQKLQELMWEVRKSYRNEKVTEIFKVKKRILKPHS
jgi:hypothetical protein